jgi:hypothetical protein
MFKALYVLKQNQLIVKTEPITVIACGPGADPPERTVCRTVFLNARSSSAAQLLLPVFHPGPPFL